MRTFAQKPKATQQTTSDKSTKPSRAFWGQSRDVSSILHLQRTIGNQAVLKLLKPAKESLDRSSTFNTSTGFAPDFTRIAVYASGRSSKQLKLKSSTPGDKYEQQADRVAEQVLRDEVREEERHKVDIQTQTTPKDLSGARDGVQRQVGSAASSSGATGRTSGLSGGAPLSDASRDFFEPRLGTDLGDVRVHSDAAGASMAGELGARAFTVGSDIVFGAGEYAPDSGSGKELLAHELAHVVQQRGAEPTVQRWSIPGRFVPPRDYEHGDMPIRIGTEGEWRAVFRNADNEAVFHQYIAGFLYASLNEVPEMPGSWCVGPGSCAPEPFNTVNDTSAPSGDQILLLLRGMWSCQQGLDLPNSSAPFSDRESTFGTQRGIELSPRVQSYYLPVFHRFLQRFQTLLIRDRSRHGRRGDSGQLDPRQVTPIANQMTEDGQIAMMVNAAATAMTAIRDYVASQSETARATSNNVIRNSGVIIGRVLRSHNDAIRVEQSFAQGVFNSVWEMVPLRQVFGDAADIRSAAKEILQSHMVNMVVGAGNDSMANRVQTMVQEFEEATGTPEIPIEQLDANTRTLMATTFRSAVQYGTSQT